MDRHDDTWGCIVGVVVAGAAIWWAWTKYEVREREPEQLAMPAPPIRPIAPFMITTTNSGSVWRLDPTTVRGGRDARFAWVSVDHSKDKTQSARTSKSLYRVDCTSGATQELSFTTYDADGKVLYSSDVKPEDAKTHYYPPDTVGSSVQREVCNPIYDEATPASSGVRADSSQ